MQVVQRKISDLKPAEYNPRKLSRKQHGELKKSLEGFGIVEPAIINIHPDRNNIIIGGHQRIKVALELGYEEFPCFEVSLPPEKERELNIRLNRNLGEWDMETLAENFNVKDLLNWGFVKDDLQLSKLVQSVNEDDVPKPPKRISTKAGDLYELGSHRLLCGDATVKENLDKLMGAEKVGLVFTSPPYNMKAGLYAGYKDNRNNSDFILFNIQVLMNWKTALKPKGFVFWNMSYNKNSGSSFLEVYYQFIKNTGLVFLEDIVWDKGHGMPLAEQLTRQYEHILALNESAENIHFVDHIGVFGVKKVPFIKTKKKGITNYWRLDTFRTQSESLKAAFPVELPQRAIEITTDRGDAIGDPFGGSGTTLIAAEKTGRQAFLMELDPINCDVVVSRYVKFTGKATVKLNGKNIDWTTD